LRYPSAFSWLPLVAGASLVRSLRRLEATQAYLKWPNDVLVDSLKLAGILCEVVKDDRVVVGVGLNIAFRSQNPPSAGATSLETVLPSGSQDLDALVSFFLSSLKSWASLSKKNVAAQSRALVVPVMATLNQRVKVVELGGESWVGMAEDLDESGHLLVRENGARSLRTVIASDIEHLRQ
jgi:BirA family biotin operon repressor/biotin-[acetyl-CoA-carboxylase] ligase